MREPIQPHLTRALLLGLLATAALVIAGAAAAAPAPAPTAPAASAFAPLTVTVVDDVDPAEHGGLITYTITVTNTGSEPAANPTVTMTLNDMHYSSIQSSQGVFQDMDKVCKGLPSIGATGTQITCRIHNLPPAASWTLTLTVAATTNGAVGSVTETASVTSNTLPTATTPATDSETTTLAGNASAPATVTVTDSPTTAEHGGLITYTVTATNNGADPIANPTLTLDLNNLHYSSIQSSQGVFQDMNKVCTLPSIGATGTQIICRIHALQPAASWTLTLVVAATTNGAVASVTETASLTSNTAPTATTPASDSESTTLAGNASAPATVTVADSPDPAKHGGLITYTITATNNGADPIANPTLTMDLTNLHYSSIQSSQGVFQDMDKVCPSLPSIGATGTQIICRIHALQPAASWTMTLVVAATNNGAVNSVTETASLTSNTAPTATTAATDSETTTLEPPTAVAIRALAASRTPAGVVVRWRTAAETSVLGYHVYREVDARLVRATPRLVAARGSAAGAAYRFVDRAAPQRQSVRYRLQAVYLDGTRAWLGRAVAVRRR